MPNEDKKIGGSLVLNLRTWWRHVKTLYKSYFRSFFPIFELEGITKHLMTGPSGNSEFCFPSTLMFPSASPRGTLRVSGKQNSLFPLGPVIKCLLYHAYKYGKRTHEFLGAFLFTFQSSFPRFWGVFNKTIIPLALVGYEMIIANSALCASFAIYLISNARSWNNR